MGQAAVELPDSPGKITSADDLLSQLAGQEIDRMLAETGDTAPAAPDPAESEPSAAAPADSAPKEDEPLASQFDELFKQLNESKIEGAPTKAAAPVTAPVAETTPSETLAASEQIAPDSAAAVAETTTPEPVDESEPELSTTAAERAALQEPTPEPEAPAAEIESPIEQKPAPAAEVAKVPTHAEPAPAAKAAAPATVAAPTITQSAPTDEARASILVRILEIINAPLASCPDSVRDALGKVAILTMMNAVGVLFYLMIFKK